jgi:hypothetical protein
MDETLNTLWSVWAWCLLPLSGAAEHSIAPLVAWHARLMVLAWSVLIPLGVIAARFYKVTPQQDFPRVLDNKFWWVAHRTTQYTGVAMAVIAVLLVWPARGWNWNWGWHQALGYALLALGACQVLGAQLRGTKGGPSDVAKGLPLRGDHFDMTRHRRIFEWWHKRMGYASLVLTVMATALGLVLADAPRWMALAIAMWWALLVFVFIWLQRQGRAIDTYTAIWGHAFRESPMRVDE